MHKVSPDHYTEEVIPLDTENTKGLKMTCAVKWQSLVVNDSKRNAIKNSTEFESLNIMPCHGITKSPADCNALKARNIELERELIQMTKEVDKLKGLNKIYENKVSILEKEKKDLLRTKADNEKLKTSCEQLKRESKKHLNQVKTLSKFKDLYKQLEVKSKEEIKELQGIIEERADEAEQARIAMSDLKKKLETKKENNFDDELESFVKIEQLQQEVKKMSEEKKHHEVTWLSSEQTITNLQSRLKEKTKELQSQQERFVILRKSFEESQNAIDHLKKQKIKTAKA